MVLGALIERVGMRIRGQRGQGFRVELVLATHTEGSLYYAYIQGNKLLYG